MTDWRGEEDGEESAGGKGENGGSINNKEVMQSSRLFNPFKTLGLVSNDVPCVLRYIHKRRENFVITCTGKSISTFVGQQLKLISTSEYEENFITCMASDTYHVYTAMKDAKHVFAWRRGTELSHKYSTSEHKSDVIHLLPFGENLLSIDEDCVICIFNIKSEEIIKTIVLPTSNEDTVVSAVIHPLTFQNKILLGFTDGLLKLININTNQVVYQFDRFQGSRINTIVQAPARGFVALGLSTKEIVLFNIEYDLIAFKLIGLEEPTSISFRTDGPDVIIVGGNKGSITAWDLNSKEMISFVKEAHRAPVKGLVSFMSEPIFITSSGDNAVKVWIFDKPDGGFRLLNSREGHRAPPTMARFHGEQFPSILTTGEDNTLRSFHLFNETYNRTISNFSSNEKDPNRGVVVNCFTNYGGHHQPVAEDIVAFNRYQPSELYTFLYEDCKRGKSISTAFENFIITCAYITTDQQWVLVGFKDGKVNLYNLQSKRLKRTIIQSGGPEISGIALSSTETAAVVGSSKALSFFEFPSGTLKHTIDCTWPVRKIFSRPGSNLCGIVQADFDILVYDVSTHKAVRRLTGCRNPISDATFSPDIKWVTAATIDSCVVTWDVPTGNMIDIFRIYDTSITSLDFSPRGDFLVTTASNEVGLKLWVNRSVFELISTLPIPQDFIPDDLDDDGISIESDDENDRNPLTYKYSNLYNGPICLGELPKFHWKELLNLSSIKARNKPAPAFKPKRNLPFMLTDLDKEKTRALSSITPDALPTTSLTSGNQMLTMLLSPFGREMTNLVSKRDSLSHQDFVTACESLIEKLVNMGPSQIDMEIRSWDPQCGGSMQLLTDFLTITQFMTSKKQHLQIIQSCLALYHKLYHKVIREGEALELEKTLLECMEVIRGDLLKSCSLIDSLIEFPTDNLY